MPYETTIIQVKDDLGVQLPDGILQTHQMQKGDRVHIVETAQGLLILPYDADFDEAVRLFEEGNEALQDVLQNLSRDAT